MCLKKPAPSAKIKTKELQGIKIPILGSKQNADKPDRDPSVILGTRGFDRQSIQISTHNLMVEKTDMQNNYKKKKNNLHNHKMSVTYHPANISTINGTIIDTLQARSIMVKTSSEHFISVCPEPFPLHPDDNPPAGTD